MSSRPTLKKLRAMTLIMLYNKTMRHEQLQMQQQNRLEAPGYFHGLNEMQRQAAETLEGPLLVLAGAGTGKTRVLTTRLAHILATSRAWPSQILAVTFTNKAAQEMRERVSVLMNGAIEGLWLGTFHSLCVRILRTHAEYVGLTRDFTILDTDDQLRLIKQLIEAEKLDDKKWPARAVLATISRWKDRGLTPEKVPPHEVDSRNNPMLTLYKQYQQRLRTFNAVDFGDLLLHCLDLFTSQVEVLQQYQNQFRYILVDEYQDTNVSQYLWLRLLAATSKNICCVGDDDQSIYGWRGAEVSNILRFEKDFPGATVIRLEQNYRSTPHILGAASGLISQNKGRLGKSLWTQTDQGEKVTICGLWDGQEEARVIGDEIESMQRSHEPLSSMAILVRAGFQTREFEDRFLTMGLPYRVIGGARFYERLEIRDALAYLRVAAQPQNSLAFERIINTPRRGIGTASLQTLHQLARMEEISMYEAAQKIIDTDEVRGKARTSLQKLLYDIERWHHQAFALESHELARIVLDESGYTQMWQNDKSPDAPGRLENLKEFVRALEEFESLQGFLEHVSLVMENNSDRQSDAVNIMTLHSAKGLEFNTVFLAGWEEGLFPHPRSLKDSGIVALEEERRLAYVGLTRAKKKAIISYAINRRVHGVWHSSPPSRFLEELPREHIEVTQQPGLHQPHQLRRNRNYHGGASESGKVIQLTPAKQSGKFARGTRVFHHKFGYGHVLSTDHDKLEIHFDISGHKKVVASFIRLATEI